MKSLRVLASSGHYKNPGQVGQSEVQTSAPIAPPACVQGCLESLVGEPWRSFRGQFAYGYDEEPRGHGFLVRQAHVLSSSGVKPKATGAMMEGIRTVKVETYFDLSYRIAVKGPWEQKVADALAGNVSRFGVLSLGESSDVVTWIDEAPPTQNTRWIVPGNRMALIIESGRGFDRITARYGTFDFGPRPHWFGEPEGVDDDFLDVLDLFSEGK